MPLGNYSLNANFLMLTKEQYDAEMVRVKTHMDMVSDMEIATMRVDSAAFFPSDVREHDGEFSG